MGETIAPNRCAIILIGALTLAPTAIPLIISSRESYSAASGNFSEARFGRHQVSLSWWMNT